jgi:hypothetical protein
MGTREIIWQLYEPNCQVQKRLHNYLNELGGAYSENPKILRERTFAKRELKRVNDRIEYLIEKCEPETYAKALLERDS